MPEDHSDQWADLLASQSRNIMHSKASAPWVKSQSCSLLEYPPASESIFLVCGNIKCQLCFYLISCILPNNVNVVYSLWWLQCHILFLVITTNLLCQTLWYCGLLGWHCDLELPEFQLYHSSTLTQEKSVPRRIFSYYLKLQVCALCHL